MITTKKFFHIIGVLAILFAPFASTMAASTQSLGNDSGPLDLKAVKRADFDYNLNMQAGDKKVELLRFDLELRGDEGATMTWLGLRQNGFENRVTNIEAYFGNTKLGRTILNTDIYGSVIDFYGLSQYFSKNTANTISIYGDILPSSTQSQATIAFAGADFKGASTRKIKSILHISDNIISRVTLEKSAPSNITTQTIDELVGTPCDSTKYTTAPMTISNNALYNQLKGKIILKTEENGEAFYINPKKQEMYYLCRPAHTFAIMRLLGTGATTDFIRHLPLGFLHISGLDSDNDGLADIFEEGIFTNKLSQDTDQDGVNDMAEIIAQTDPLGFDNYLPDNINANKRLGEIFLQVENNGEAWYINPQDAKRYYLGRPADAFQIMQSLGVGISNSDFEKL